MSTVHDPNMICPECKAPVAVDGLWHARDEAGWHAHQPWLRSAIEAEMAGGMGDWGGPGADEFYDRSVAETMERIRRAANGEPEPNAPRRRRTSR